ncbi:MAG: hypothetical protein M1816_001900 [Peltula sp. TS41687]|nr:MAG: hypothetical protein M1816_001900 [Peltula sp. TS41687]
MSSEESQIPMFREARLDAKKTKLSRDDAMSTRRDVDGDQAPRQKPRPRLSVRSKIDDEETVEEATIEEIAPYLNREENEYFRRAQKVYKELRAEGIKKLVQDESTQANMEGRPPRDEPTHEEVQRYLVPEQKARYQKAQEDIQELRHRGTRRLVASGRARPEVVAYYRRLVASKGKSQAKNTADQPSMTSPTKPQWLEPPTDSSDSAAIMKDYRLEKKAIELKVNSGFKTPEDAKLELRKNLGRILHRYSSIGGYRLTRSPHSVLKDFEDKAGLADILFQEPKNLPIQDLGSDIPEGTLTAWNARNQEFIRKEFAASKYYLAKRKSRLAAKYLTAALERAERMLRDRLKFILAITPKGKEAKGPSKPKPKMAPFDV